MIIAKGKGKMREVVNSEEIKAMYTEAINGKKAYSWTGPGSYTTVKAIKDLHANGKLYRPLARAFGLVD